jgi:hypothetical protein
LMLGKHSQVYKFSLEGQGDRASIQPVKIPGN